MTETDEQRAKREQDDQGKPWQGLEGEEREQAIRDHFGYAASETRTQAERDAAAVRMMAKAPLTPEADEAIERLRREETVRLGKRERSTDFGNKMG
jgi:hypothetical protein